MILLIILPNLILLYFIDEITIKVNFKFRFFFWK